MSGERFMRIGSAEFQAMAERVLQVTELTSRLNVLPFGDETSKPLLLEQILGRALPAGLTIYPPSTPTMGSTWTSPSACSSTKAAPSSTTPASASASAS